MDDLLVWKWHQWYSSWWNGSGKNFTNHITVRVSKFCSDVQLYKFYYFENITVGTRYCNIKSKYIIFLYGSFFSLDLSVMICTCHTLSSVYYKLFTLLILSSFFTFIPLCWNYSYLFSLNNCTVCMYMYVCVYIWDMNYCIKVFYFQFHLLS